MIGLSENCWLSAIFLNASGLRFLVRDEYLLEAHQPGKDDRNKADRSLYCLPTQSLCYQTRFSRHQTPSWFWSRQKGKWWSSQARGWSRESGTGERARYVSSSRREAWCRNTESGESTPLVQIWLITHEMRMTNHQWLRQCIGCRPGGRSWGGQWRPQRGGTAASGPQCSQQPPHLPR